MTTSEPSYQEQALRAEIEVLTKERDKAERALDATNEMRVTMHRVISERDEYRRRLESTPPWPPDHGEPMDDAQMRALQQRWSCGPEQYQADADALIATTLAARADVARLTQERDALAAEATAVHDRLTAALVEVDAVLRHVPGAVRVREGGGPENLLASLAVTVSDLVADRDRLVAAMVADRDRPRLTREMDGWRLRADDLSSARDGAERDAAAARAEVARLTQERDEAREKCSAPWCKEREWRFMRDERDRLAVALADLREAALVAVQSLYEEQTRCPLCGTGEDDDGAGHSADDCDLAALAATLAVTHTPANLVSAHDARIAESVRERCVRLVDWHADHDADLSALADAMRSMPLDESEHVERGGR